jgi:tetratricopeptide (TPR) repeat protein
VKSADDLGQDFNRWKNRTRVGEALHNLGRYEEAAHVFSKAEDIMRRTEGQSLYMYAISGFRYLEFLLTIGAYQDVQDRASWMLRWVAENPGNASATSITVALSYLYLGYAEMLGTRSDCTRGLAEAQKHFDRALNDLQQTEWQDLAIRGLLARAQLKRITRQFQDAELDLKNAISIATRSGTRLRLADCHLAYAQLLMVWGGQAGANGHLSQAKRMIEGMNYHRRDKEVLELEAASTSITSI